MVCLFVCFIAVHEADRTLRAVGHDCVVSSQTRIPMRRLGAAQDERLSGT